MKLLLSLVTAVVSTEEGLVTYCSLPVHMENMRKIEKAGDSIQSKCAKQTKRPHIFDMTRYGGLEDDPGEFQDEDLTKNIFKNSNRFLTKI